MRESLRVTPFNEAINDMPRADLDAPKKQWGTARRVLATLVDEVPASAISSSPRPTGLTWFSFCVQGISGRAAGGRPTCG